jgi:alkyl hydroperoxide reductase subunit AhpC
VGLSVDTEESHRLWLQDVEELATGNAKAEYPVVADPEGKVAALYQMLDEASTTTDTGSHLTVRSAYFIDPKQRVRAVVTYPATVGRDFQEMMRLFDALQLHDKEGLVLPADWKPGKCAIVPPSIPTSKAVAKYGKENVVEVKPYLREVHLPKVTG